MEILTLTLQIIFVLFFVGYGFTALFIPEKLRRDAFWLVPWFGIIFIALLGVILSLAGIPIIKSKNIILFLSSFLLFWAIVNRKKIFFLSKETILIGLLTAICIFFNLYPLLVKAGFPTTISLGNLDPIAYVHTGDFLIDHTIYEGKNYLQYKPSSAAVVDLIGYWYRWGTPTVLGFIANIFNMKSYQIFSILITLFFTLSFPLVYILAKQFMDQKKSYLLLFLTFFTYGMNSTILYMLYNVFFAQFAFLGIFITVLILLHSYFSSKSETTGFNSYDLLISFCLSSLTTIYLEGLLFILVPLAIFASIKLFQKRYFYLINIAKFILLSFVINPISFGNAMRANYAIFASTTKTTLIGWEKIRYALPYEMIGIHNLYYSRNLPFFLGIMFSIIIGGIILIGLSKSKQKIFIGSFIGFFVVLYLMFAFVFKNFFTYHRAVTYTLFIIPTLFSCGMFVILNLIKNKFLIIFILVIISLMSLRSFYRTIYQFYWHPKIVDKSLTSLTALNNNKKYNGSFFTSDVFLGEYNLWNRLWQEYFLTDKLIISRQNYPSEIDKLNDISLVLSEKNYMERDGKKIVYKNIVWQNQYYLLGEILTLEVAQDLKNYQ